jgi:prepilin-type N-terminal cleavage/methylation domain-containing protein
MTMRAAGFSLIEVLVALFLIAIGVLAVAPMFIYASRGSATGGDFGLVGAMAVERMERLRESEYENLDVGGSTTTNVSSYFDDSDPDVVVRWQISAHANPSETQRITVRAVSRRTGIGPRREVTLTTLRGL